MHVKPLLHKLLAPVIHQARLNLLIQLVTGVIDTKQLKLTALGRGIALQIKERSGIRKVDRFLSNLFFQTHTAVIYKALARGVVGNQARPHILVDWTKLPNVEAYALRAALVAEGRALTLYEEVHPKHKEGTARVHRAFLNCLKSLLPAGCKPIIITDAGFKNPWFKVVAQLGWDFIGRVRGLMHYGEAGQWTKPCRSLHAQATLVPRYLGEFSLTKKNPLRMSFYLVRQTLKGRKRYTRKGQVCRDKDSKNYGRSYREPWLLVSSINKRQAAAKVVKLYRRRMTIEEGFRDTKSHCYGLSLNTNVTQKSQRLIVWLMLGALASYLAWLVGYAGEKQKLHYEFQANSLRHRRVLSYFYLGCQIIRKKIRVPLDVGTIKFVKEEIYL